MRKNKVVQFDDGYAKIITTLDVSGYVHDGKTTFINPVLTHLKGVPPELWTVANSQIVALPQEEQDKRIKSLTIESEVAGTGKGSPEFSSLVDEVAYNELILDQVCDSLAEIDIRLKSIEARIEHCEGADKLMSKRLKFVTATVIASFLAISLFILTGGN